VSTWDRPDCPGLRRDRGTLAAPPTRRRADRPRGAGQEPGRWAQHQPSSGRGL